jgi:hypothetical protein
MTTFLYRCPKIDMEIQGFVAGGNKDNTFHVVTCTGCGRVHLVNPKTGRIVGETWGCHAEHDTAIN